MKKSVKLYMIQDLLVLTIIGALLEGICQRFASTILSGTPTIAFGLLITFIAVVRWNLWGLLVTPFLALATMIGGMNGEIEYLADVYDWRVLISEMIGLWVCGLNVIAFRKNRTKRVMSTIWQVVLMIIVDYLLYCVVQIFVYRLLTSGNPLRMGDLTGYYTVVTAEFAEDGETIETIVNHNVAVNLCTYIDGSPIFNLFGLVVALVGVLVLRSQGVTNNAISKLIDDKRMAEAEAEYLNSLGNANKNTQVEAEANSNEFKTDDNPNLDENGENSKEN